MSDNQQPREYDVVLGGQSQSLEGAAVLGGIEGVKFRLSNPDSKVRVAALYQALNYGEQGLDLVIHSLQHESPQVQIQAYSLLTSRTELKVKQALLKFNPKILKLEPIEVVTVNSYGDIIQRQQHLAKYFIEDLGNGVTLEMAAIPGGNFMMGSPENEKSRCDNESPQHKVTVPSFFMGKYPVTQEQYQVIMGNNPSSRRFSNNLPVECVSWDDAVEFCQKLSQKTGKNYRLPHEAEWEYACRSGTTTPFYFGETITPELANYTLSFLTYADEPIVKQEKSQSIEEVGTFPPNAFGLYDMHGNVWEWCQDDCNGNYNYINAPIDGSGWIGQSIDKRLRGGSYNIYPSHCRSAFRALHRHNVRYPVLGFRIVADSFSF
ncbi:MAG: formylglycine-generating enzyme family protein [Nostoc sp.]|uniref:formylglycine-generating enzyme family protein n=1 Tax=Nostoc sp. TaxID=1180 RepID=UPI002FFD27C5